MTDLFLFSVRAAVRHDHILLRRRDEKVGQAAAGKRDDDIIDAQPKYKVRRAGGRDLGWVDIQIFLHSTACLILLGQLKSGQNGLWSWASNGHILFGRGDSFGTVIYLEITPTGKGHSWRIYPPKISAGEFSLPKGFVAPFREGVSYWDRLQVIISTDLGHYY